MSDKIEITFQHNGVSLTGHFSRVAGAGSTACYHLYVGDYYRGQLHYTSDGWRFNSQSGELDYLEEEFGEKIKEYTK